MIEELFKMVMENPDNISIKYSNINGKESLIVNGKDFSLKEETFDDSKTLALVNEYKKNIELVDDCVFVEMLDEIKGIIDLKQLDELLNQESYTEEESELVVGVINYMNTIIHEKIQNKIQDLEELLERF